MVNVLFATNRVKNPDGAAERFGSDVSKDPKLFYGVTSVDGIDITDPSSGALGDISGGRGDGFAADQLTQLQNSSNDILVFIHGCANSFTNSITRAAYNQSWLAASLLPNSNFDVIAFSWPARSYFIANILGDYFDYRSDQSAAENSAAHCATFLQQIAKLRAAIPDQGPRRRRIHLLCHSMGNYVLGGALPGFVATNPPAADAAKLFDEVVLAAADEPANTFLNKNARLNQLASLARQITVYFSSDDIAMDLSQIVNGTYRLGYQGPANMADTGFFSPAIYQFVDCSNCNDYISSLITAPDRSHQYYRQSPTVRQDIVMSLAGFTPVRLKYDQKANDYSLFPS
jgi:esterase/lipase superfamily enzyme